MKISIQIYVLLLSFFILGSCTAPPNVPSVERTDEDYDRLNSNRDARNEVIRRTENRYSGNQCVDEDRGADCRDDCREIYNRRSDRTDCEELTIRQIEEIKKVYDDLENPRKNNLEELDLDIFDLYINISIASLDRLIGGAGGYSAKEAETFLLWLIAEPEFANKFRDADDDHRSLDTLLKRIHSDPIQAFINREEIIESAITEGDDVIEWFQDYIDEKITVCEDNPVSVGCFEQYCRIGSKIDDDARDDWLRSSEFEEYIQDILRDSVNVNNWRASLRTINDPDVNQDIGNWVTDLCSGLADTSSSGGQPDSTNKITTTDGRCFSAEDFFAVDRDITIRNDDLRSTAEVDGLSLTTLQGNVSIRDIGGTGDIVVSVDSTNVRLKKRYGQYVTACKNVNISCYVYWPSAGSGDSATSNVKVALSGGFTNADLNDNALKFAYTPSTDLPQVTGTTLEELPIYFAIRRNGKCYSLNTGFSDIRAIRALVNQR